MVKEILKLTTLSDLKMILEDFAQFTFFFIFENRQIDRQTDNQFANRASN